MAEKRAEPGGVIEPIPAFEAYEAFAYAAATLRSPFDRPVDIRQLTALSARAALRPDSNRPKQYLERFTLDSLFMVGCDEEDAFKKVEPLLNAMGTTIIRCGQVGSGIRAKVVNNFQILSIAQITAEALTLAQKIGLDLETFKEVNAGTTANNGQFHINFLSKVLQNDIEPGFTIDLAHKDMGLAIETANSFRVGLPVGSSVQAVYAQARSGKFAKKDFSALLDYACELAEVSPPRIKK